MKAEQVHAERPDKISTRFEIKQVIYENAPVTRSGSHGSLLKSVVGMLVAQGWAPLLLATVAFLVYWPSLKSDFVYDAHIEIFDEGFVASPSNLSAVLSLKVVGMKLMLADRPGQILYLMLNAKIWGKNPWGYHLCSNLLHAANVALLFVLFRSLIATELTPLAKIHRLKVQIMLMATTLIFALHPIAVEPVSGVSYSSDLLVTFFTLLGLLLATAFRADSLPVAILTGGASAFCAFASVICKESGIATALLLIVYWLLFRRREPVIPWLLLLGAATGVTVIFLAARFYFAPPGQIPSDYLGGSFSHVFLIQPRLWVFMISQLVCPVHLSADYTLENLTNLSTPEALGMLITVLLLQTRLAAKSRLGAMGVAFYWLGLMTVSNFVPLYRILADRFYYLPLAGVTMQLMALVLMTLRSSTGFRVSAALLFSVLLPLTMLTVAREKVFSNDFTLWTDTVQVSPFSWIAQYNLGNVLLGNRKVNESIVMYHRALEINPSYADAHYNLGIALSQKGKLDEAMVQYQSALVIDSNYANAQYNLGDILLEKGQFDEAITQFQKVLQIDPNYAAAQNNLDFAYSQEENANDSMAPPHRPLQGNPKEVVTLVNLGSDLFEKGHVDEAIADYQKALQINPHYAKAHNNLGYALFQKGQVEQARAQFQLALRP
jgi:tetratricopeptide (TPR) repeat protein